jgi:hypothetical protein
VVELAEDGEEEAPTQEVDGGDRAALRLAQVTRHPHLVLARASSPMMANNEVKWRCIQSLGRSCDARQRGGCSGGGRHAARGHRGIHHGGSFFSLALCLPEA